MKPVETDAERIDRLRRETAADPEFAVRVRAERVAQGLPPYIESESFYTLFNRALEVSAPQANTHRGRARRGLASQGRASQGEVRQGKAPTIETPTSAPVTPKRTRKKPAA